MNSPGAQPVTHGRADPDAGSETEADTETETERRRRREQVFGEALPESTRDDRTGGEEAGAADGAEDWLRRQVPPHHG